MGDLGPHLGSAINPLCVTSAKSLSSGPQSSHLSNVEARSDELSLGFLLVTRDKIPLPGDLSGETLRNALWEEKALIRSLCQFPRCKSQRGQFQTTSRMP